MPKLSDIDVGWINALKPYLGGGIVPIYRKPDGSIDAEKTMDQFCSLYGLKKLDSNGVPID